MIRRRCVLGVIMLFTVTQVIANTETSESSPARATIPAPVKQVQGARLVGEGTLRWLGFRVYEARLFGSDDFVPDERWSVGSFALELAYSRALSGQMIANSSASEIERMQIGTEFQRADWKQSLLQLFPDVKAGDRIIGVYRPAQGTSFYFNDKRIGKISDPELSIAFFSIWMDTRTRDKKLRLALLGQLK
jgi:Chalcone isomerase-like